MRRLLPWLFVLVLVGIGGLALSRWVVAQVDADQQQVKLLAGQAQPGTPTPEIISAERLFDPALDPQSRASVAEKLEMKTRQAADLAAGEANPAPKDKMPPTPTVEKQLLANATALSGIFSGSEGMVKPDQAAINNYWQGSLNGRATMVLAGSEPQDTTQGLVIVVSSDGFAVSDYQVIDAPAGVSSLTVVDALETTLVLQDLDGTRLVFDLPTLSFVK
jgi:hypothetical protein